MTDPFNDMARWFDRQYGDCPDYPEAVTRLVDALRGYVRCDEEAESDAISEGWEQPPKEVKRKWDAHMGVIRALLKDLEAKDIDPWLCGTIDHTKGKRSEW